MSIKTILQAIVGERLDLLTKTELLEAIEVADIAMQLGRDHYLVLRCCHNEGPIADGGVPSKTHRNDLLEVGAIARVAVAGVPGYNACTARGCDLLRALESMPPENTGRD